MSFRLFIYYCALGGGCGAFLGWALGRALAGGEPVVQAGLKAMFLGMMMALGLGITDAISNRSLAQVGQVSVRLLVAVAVGCVGGFLGGMIGQVLYGWLDLSFFLIVGWTVTGLLIGASQGVFDLLSQALKNEDTSGARRKVVNGILGGTGGGLFGGLLYLIIRVALGQIFGDRSADDLWAPSATGFVALGLSIGLLIGLAQVILKEAWVRVERGFRAGRELILSKPETTIGRAESCDIGLFGDPSVERLHASIQVEGDLYQLVDAGTSDGTFLNGERIAGPTPLHTGDLIGVGGSRLRFGERAKRLDTGNDTGHG